MMSKDLQPEIYRNYQTTNGDAKVEMKTFLVNSFSPTYFINYNKIPVYSNIYKKNGLRARVNLSSLDLAMTLLND